jgi:short-subunit dehydrogenase
MNLKNMVCVITGAGRGLGKSLAKELHNRGVKLILGDIDMDNLCQVAKELGASALHCDVTKQHDVEMLAEEAVKQCGRIDIWINNAGIWMPYSRVEEIDFSRARSLMEVNYFGLAYGTIAAVKLMRPVNSGCIINIISIRALAGKAMAAGYSASKFAAEGFTQAVREELKDTGLRVIGVYPHRIKTELFGDNKHADYESSMNPDSVARAIIDNLATDNPSEHLEIWDHNDVRNG